eukprot:TRINITY_DN3887_c0_g1_i1.p1 TRINITY_DN3887_c0_g1~~TRINITY_DN3887_c0_g1_i1.p1  ORF type:complete len:135 (-),score=8.16 TRINITY_DN3887_c0_g1_i1:133-537(-)
MEGEADVVSTIIPKDPLEGVELVEPTIKISQSSHTFMDAQIHFQIIHLKDSFYLWIGTGLPKMGQLSLAFTTPFDSVPSVSNITDPSMEQFSNALALRLAKRLKKPIYVSCALSQNSPMMQVFLEKQVMKELSL